MRDYNTFVENSKKMSFLESSMLQKIFYCLIIFCFCVSFIFTVKKCQNGIPGQGEFIISNSIFPGKETN